MNPQKIKQIVSDAIDLAPDKRDAFVRRECGDDQSLLAEVLSLLNAASNASDAGFLPSEAVGGAPEEPATIQSAGHAGETIFAPIGEKPGSVIGRYKLLQQIGEGGFGVVFMAEQEKPVRRIVALKVIKLGMDTREVVARFEAERQALAMMDHPNIAKVLDVGSTETGRPYFVMELVRGSPITDYADKHKLSLRDRVALAALVCRAVQHAHSKGIIHRDLKPSNVLVTVTDDKPVPKVIDFGIAKATQSKLTDRTLFTAFRQLIGTPQYMSPEQADSDGSDIDTRTDVYSLGVLLYELLVGTTPFDAKSLRSAAYEEMRRLIRDSEIPHPSTRLRTLAANTVSSVTSNRSTDLKKLDQSVKGELDWIVMKALEKDRVRRYETAAALADDLGRYLAGDAVLAGPVGGMYRLKKLARRHRAAIGIAAVVGFALLLGVAGTTFGLIRETHQRQVAELQKSDADHARAEANRQKSTAEQQRDNAKAVTEFLTDDVLGSATPDVIPDKAVRDQIVKALIEPAMAKVNARFKDKPLIEATVQTTLSETLRGLGRSDLALPLITAAVATRHRLLGDDAADTLDSVYEQGEVLIELGRSREAIPLMKAVWESDSRQWGADGFRARLGELAYTRALSLVGRSDEVFVLLKEAYDRDRRVLGENDSQTLQSMSAYARALIAAQKFDEAVPLELHFWDQSRIHSGENSEETLLALENYGTALNSSSQPSEGIPLLERAWRGLDRQLGSDHPGTMRAMENYILALNASHRNTDAEIPAKELMERRRRVQGADNYDTVRMIGFYGLILAALDRPAEAEPVLKEAVERERRILGSDHPNTLASISSYGMVLGALRRYAEAEALGSEELERTRHLYGDDHPGTVIAKWNYACLLMEMGRFADAEPLVKHILGQRQLALGEDHRDTMLTQGLYAEILLGLGQNAEAERILAALVERRRRVSGNDDLEASDDIFDEGHALVELGRYTEAEPLIKSAWERYARVKGETASRTLKCQSFYAVVLKNLAKSAEAEPLARSAWERVRQQAGAEQRTAELAGNAAAVMVAAGHPAEAEPLARSAWEWRKGNEWPDHLLTVQAEAGYADVLAALGHWSEAEPLYRDALAAAMRNPSIGPTHPAARAVARGLATCLDQLDRGTDGAAIRLQFEVAGPATTRTAG